MKKLRMRPRAAERSKSNTTVADQCFAAQRAAGDNSNRVEVARVAKRVVKRHVTRQKRRIRAVCQAILAFPPLPPFLLSIRYYHFISFYAYFSLRSLPFDHFETSILVHLSSGLFPSFLFGFCFSCFLSHVIFCSCVTIHRITSQVC